MIIGHPPPQLVVSPSELPWRIEDGGLEGKDHVLLTSPTPHCATLAHCKHEPWRNSRFPSQGPASLLQSQLPLTPCPLPSEVSHLCHQEGLGSELPPSSSQGLVT